MSGKIETATIIGEAAKTLHVAAKFDVRINKMFVIESGDRHFTFECYRHPKSHQHLVATLTALTDNRVCVDYHDGRESEILYL